MRVIDFEKLDGILLDSLLCGDSVQQLFDRVYDFLKLPLICFDTTFHLVAYAFPRPFYYPNWEYIVEHGGASESDILGYNYLEYQERMYKNGRSLYFDTGTCDGFPQACRPRALGRAAGCLLRHNDRGRDKGGDPARNDLLSRTVSRLMLDSERSGIRDTAERLLIQNECGAAEAAELARRAGASILLRNFFRRGARCLHARIRARHTLRPGQGRCRLPGRLRAAVHIAERAGQRGERHRTPQSDRHADAAVSPALRGERLFLRPRGDLGAARTGAARAVLPGGRRPRANFRENYVEIVEHCACDYYGSRASQLKCLDALEDADGELLKTLELYLRSSRRPAAVAEALGLHRNTVINRIRKAEELLGARPH